MTFGAILAALTAIFAAIPVMLKFFQVPTESKIEDAEEELRKQMDKFKETGRPPE